MKITFLGTSHGYAEAGRFQSSALIEVRGKSYIMDAGAPIEYQLATLGKDFNSVEGIFITHAHLDHVGGLAQIVEPFLRYRYNDKCSVFLPDETISKGFDALMSACNVNLEKMKSIVKFNIVKAGLIFDDGNIKVTAVPTKHMTNDIHASFGYIIDDGEKTVLFTGDMAGGFPEYRDVTAGKYDLVICEMAHADLCNVWQMMAKTDTRKMLINHYHMPRLEGYEEIFRNMPFDTQLAMENQEVIV